MECSSRNTVAAVSLSLLLGSCGGGEDHRSLDGGYALEKPDPAGDEHRETDSFWRRERGRWHWSVGHSEEMLAPQKVFGIWVRSYEISDFYPGARTERDIDEMARARFSLEIDSDQVEEIVGRQTEGSDFHFIALSLVARRTRYPLIDCHGGRLYTIVAQRLEHARYLSTKFTGQGGRTKLPRIPPWKPFELSGEGGVVGEREKKALARCGVR
jgi:hypothetical protein